MTSSNPDVATIARGLTEAQREAMIGACMTHPDVGGEAFVTVDFTGPWPVAGIAQFFTLRTDRLTPLGLSVRAHLLENKP